MPPTTNAKQAELERFYDDLQYLLELSEQYSVNYMIVNTLL